MPSQLRTLPMPTLDALQATPKTFEKLGSLKSVPVSSSYLSLQMLL